MKVSADNIRLSYGAEEILKSVSIGAEDKEFVGLIGPNGSGKSTLLKCIYRILKDVYKRQAASSANCGSK